jgi:hypothetical protein
MIIFFIKINKYIMSDTEDIITDSRSSQDEQQSEYE